MQETPRVSGCFKQSFLIRPLGCLFDHSVGFYKGLGKAGLLTWPQESPKSVLARVAGMDGGHQLSPETFLLQRDSNQVRKNTEDCVGRDLLEVQNAAMEQ